METIKNNISRVGNFTSSEIVALTKVSKDKKSFLAAALTYISECNMERKLGRALNEESNARPLAWGTLMEKRVNDLLPLEYIFKTDQTISHPTIDCFKGSPDGEKPNITVEIKAPMTLKSFCNLVDPLYDGLTGIDAINAVRENHKDGEKYYWQMVGNSILQNTKFAELVVYCPFKSELNAVRELAGSMDEQILYKFFWIANANDDELPFLLDGGYYKNLNIISFEVPQADKELLIDCIEKASLLLIDLTKNRVLPEQQFIEQAKEMLNPNYAGKIERTKELLKKTGI